jgi:hypothetical protein
MSDGKVFNLQTNITDFGIKPRDGFKLCVKCRATIPHASFYKADLNDPTALCKTHKEQEHKFSKLNKVDSTTVVVEEN